jgi:hypothetical protein
VTGDQDLVEGRKLGLRIGGKETKGKEYNLCQVSGITFYLEYLKKQQEGPGWSDLKGEVG